MSLKIKFMDNRKYLMYGALTTVWLLLFVKLMPSMTLWLIGDYINNVPVLGSIAMVTSTLAVTFFALLFLTFFFNSKYILTNFKSKITGKSIFWKVEPNQKLTPTVAQTETPLHAILSDTESVNIVRGSALIGPHGRPSYITMPEIPHTIVPIDVIEQQKTGLNQVMIRQMNKWHELLGAEKQAKADNPKSFNWTAVVIGVSIVIMMGVIGIGELSKYNSASSNLDELRQCVAREGKYQVTPQIIYSTTPPKPYENKSSTTGIGLS